MTSQPMPYRSASQKAFGLGLRLYCGVIVAFLLVPLVVVMPLSVKGGSFLTFPLAGVSTRWYEALFASAQWSLAFRNSLLIGLAATVLSTVLGTAAAFGLRQLRPALARSLSLL